MDRKTIAKKLLTDCPDDILVDHKKIADDILSGKSRDEILSTVLEIYPDTYVWLKDVMN